MKKLLTLLAIMPLASAVHGQAITIASTDMPAPTSIFNLIDFTSSAVASPAIGTGSTWNYSAYTGTANSANYYAETIPYFTSAGIDIYRSATKTLTSGFVYNLNLEFDFNASNVEVSGINIAAQDYGLSAFTGVTTDSLNIPAQQALLTTPEVFIQFPFTANSSWSSSSRRVTNFFLTVGAASLSNAASQHVYYMHRSDTIVGWGSMSIYTAGGPSIQYSVLMDKIAEYAADSFYIGGAPAPAPLLSGFAITQGQKTDSNWRYNFYRKGSYGYLLSYYYGSDPTYSVPAGKYMDTDKIMTAPTGVNELQNGSFTTVLFPNPSNGSEINMIINGKDVSDCTYYITDVTGRVIKSGTPAKQQGGIHIALDNQLSNGNYIINLTDSKNNRIVSEQFVIAK